MALRPGGLGRGGAGGGRTGTRAGASGAGTSGAGAPGTATSGAGGASLRPPRRRRGRGAGRGQPRGSLLGAAWLALLAAVGGVVLWLALGAEQTVEQLRSDADRTSLTASSMLPELARAPVPEPAPRPGPETAAAPAARAPLPATAEAPPATAPQATAPQAAAPQATAPPMGEAAEPPPGEAATAPQATPAEAPPPPGASAEAPPTAAAPPPETAVAPPPEAVAAAIDDTPQAAPAAPPDEAAAAAPPDEVASSAPPAPAEAPEPPAAAPPTPIAPSAAAETAAAPVPAPAEPAPRPAPDAAAIPADVTALMTEPGPAGPLPRLAPDGTPPWQAFAAPYAAAGRPAIALVVADLGLSAALTERALALPGPVTLAFSPYAPEAAEWLAHARAAGHEALMQLPLEPEGFPADDPGPETLLISLGPEQNRDRLHWVMGQGVGYVGLADLTGSRFAASRDALRPVMEELARRGLIWFEGRPAGGAVPAEVAAEAGTPYLTTNMLVGDLPTAQAIDARLAVLAETARREGAAVGVVLAYPVVFDRLTAWIEGLEGQGLALVPVSALAAETGRATDG